MARVVPFALVLSAALIFSAVGQPHELHSALIPVYVDISYHPCYN